MADHDGKDGMSIPQLLMIEDDARLATMVGEYLKQSGYGVAHAGDGETGLAMLQDAPVDLVVLDLMLPGIDGLEVCRRIRAQPGEAARHQPGANEKHHGQSNLCCHQRREEPPAPFGDRPRARLPQRNRELRP